MKAIKIILIVIAIGVIGFFAWKWSAAKGNGEGEPQIIGNDDSENFITKIEEDTKKLKSLSKEDFTKSIFEKIKEELETFYNEGNLGKDSLQNEEEYKNLSKTLFAAYVPRFIDETHYKFQQSTWRNSDLKFIRNEIKEIRNNQFFDKEKSSYNSKFDNINSTISKYYEIAGFVNQSKNYPTKLDYSVDGRFPIDDVEEKIDQSKIYLNYNSNSKYLKNVTWLKDALTKIPSQIYEKNFYFLKDQIQENTEEYKNGNLKSQADYSRAIYQPLEQSLDKFDNDIYGVDYSEFRLDYEGLKNMLDNDNDKAGKYFKEKWEEEMKTKNRSSDD